MKLKLDNLGNKFLAAALKCIRLRYAIDTSKRKKFSLMLKMYNFMFTAQENISPSGPDLVARCVARQSGPV